MRKIVAGLFISLDGVVESPGSWRMFNDELAEIMAAGIAQADAILLGRNTYLEFAGMWPQMGSNSPMAAFMNGVPKHVVSSTLKTLEWANSQLVTGSLPDTIAALKAQPGKNIQIPGSPRLVRSLLRYRLLDELSLAVHPIIVGSGARLFDEVPEQLNLTLVDSRTLSTGVVSLTYRAPAA